MTAQVGRESHRSILLALGGFLAGASAVAVLVWNVGTIIGSTTITRADPGQRRTSAPLAVPGTDQGREEARSVIVPAAPAHPGAPLASESDGVYPTTGVTLPADLRLRGLNVPVLGIRREDLQESFADARSGSRVHEAMDILAPRDTPIVAVEDGRVSRLFFSKAGGITIYQFDPTEQYVYYYAHLERYADGLKEGNFLRRGQVIGYVGTSGNAPADTPHLHFAIYRLTDKKRWWEGDPIDPYKVLR